MCGFFVVRNFLHNINILLYILFHKQCIYPKKEELYEYSLKEEARQLIENTFLKDIRGSRKQMNI